MIAGRRPARRADAAEPADEERTASEPVADAKSADGDEAAPKKPARRRRSRAKKVETPAENGDVALEAPVAEEPVAEERAAPPAAIEAAVAPPEAPPELEPAAEPAPTPARRRRSTAGEQTDTASLGALVEQLASEIAGQRSALVQLGAGVDELSTRLDRAARKPRLGVFVDVPNVLYGLEAGEAPLDMGKLLAMLTEGRELVRATAYAPVSDDPREAVERQKFVAPFVPYAYRIVTKPMKRFADGSVKGNFDVEMAIDLVTMSERLDVVAIVSGDSDFAKAVETVQSRGVRVEVVAFAGSTSIEMRALADHYLELDRVTDQLR
jgi:uncharacterized LabA/DUF88 family protein